MTVPVGSNVVGGLIGVGLLHLVWLGPLAFVIQCCMCGMTVAYIEEIPALMRLFDWVTSLGMPAWFIVVVVLLSLPLAALYLLGRLSSLPTMKPLHHLLKASESALGAFLSRFHEGKLTLDQVGLKLDKGNVSMRWEAPISVRRWGVRRPGGYESRTRYYEVWELTQDEAQIRLSREVTSQKLEHLAPLPAGESGYGKSLGLLVPKKHERVFDAILWLGEAELQDAGDR
jgi:hypothetical protein